MEIIDNMVKQVHRHKLHSKSSEILDSKYLRSVSQCIKNNTRENNINPDTTSLDSKATKRNVSVDLNSADIRDDPRPMFERPKKYHCENLHFSNDKKCMLHYAKSLKLQC